MNLRLVLFSGIMTTFVGLMIGIALTHISQNEERKIVHAVGGGVLGFIIGAAASAINQQRPQQTEDDGDRDRRE